MEAFVEKKGKIADRVRRKARAQKGHNVSSNFAHQRRPKAKDKDQELPLSGQFCLETVSQKTVKSVSGKEDRPPYYGYMEGTL